MALEKHGIKPDYVAGTSIGAVIGALYCSGVSPEYMRRLVVTTEWQDLIDFTIPKTGVIAGNKFEKYMQELTNNKRFSDLSIPLRVVATDIQNSHKVVFSEGNVALAVRASISIPGVFRPVYIDRHELVDGGLVDPIPLDVVRDMGAEIVIAVDLSIDFDKLYIHGSRVRERRTFLEYVKSKFIRTQIGFLKEFVMETKRSRLPQFTKKYIIKAIDTFLNPLRIYRYFRGKGMPPIVKIAVRSILIMSSELAKQNLKTAHVDCIIRPEYKSEITFAFDEALSIIESGEKACEKMIPKIKSLLGRD